MTAKQRAHYFRDLWPAACTRQGWDVKNDAMRRDVTLEATGKEATGKLTQLEISKLFDFLKLLADPDNLSRAIPVANPEAAEVADRRRQLNHVIAGLAFADSYISRCATGLMRTENVTVWHDLSVASLEKLRYTVTTRARQRDAKAGKRDEFIPRSEPYHLRKTTKAKRAAAREPQVVPRPGVVDESLLPF